MPTGGQIAGGTGLSLQPTTPGIAERGNAHLTGAMLVEGTMGAAGGMVTAGGIRQRVAIVGEGVSVPFPQQAVGNNGPVAFGSDTVIGQTSRGFSSEYEVVVIGNTAKAAGRGDTVVGWGASCNYLSGGYNTGFSILIGRSASLSSSTTNDRGLNVCIGSNLSATQCDLLVAIGHAILAGQKGHGVFPEGKSSILIGSGIRSTAGSNQIIVDSRYNSAVLPDETRSNLIKIGDESHSTLEIAGKDFSLSGQVKYIVTVRSDVGNTVAETSLIISGVGNQTIQETAWKIGKTLRVSARGVVSITGTPTLRIKFKLGATTLLDLGGVALPAMAAGNHGWEFSADLTVLTTPSNATDVIINGIMRVAGSTADLSSAITPAAVLDLSAPVLMDMTAQWGTAHVSNSITLSQFFAELIG